ncbi:hypothetical protein G4G27_04320 [Sphingomonas sp. So64.6b]|uniref:hypothetical protein n=1 Tax=Sphingomonas sp. So64.6b TaxID=2997354 RepID=UPI0015FED7E0|nr:hypothetical protein [Sphingomonas sp. So64.6b]QNA83317.1 hypothetical protein G4G27_04320 [Sphingomonas sp. So64.6b]
MATNIGGSTDRSVSVGRVFSRAFSTIGSNPLTVFGIAFLFGALPSVAMAYLGQSLRTSVATAPNFTAWSIALPIAQVVIGIALAMIVQGALVRATVAHSQGREAGFGESALAGLQVIVPLFIVGLLLGLAVMFGLILLIVPGIMLYIMWSVAGPVLVEERSGIFAAFGRSRYLTSGARWPVFGINLLLVVIMWAFAALLGAALFAIYGLQGVAGAFAQGLPIWYLIVSSVISTVSTAISTTIQTSIYVELRDWKDGPATDALSDIFA